MNETPWPRSKLGEFLIVLTDYHANGSYERLKEHVTLLGAPDYAVMIRTTNFEREVFLDEDLKFVSEDAYNYLAKSKVLPGDILMNKIANAGSVYRMPDLHRPVSLAMNLFLIRTNEAELSQHYTFYYLKEHETYVKSFANGTAAKTITKEAVRNLEIAVPPRLVQDKIVNVLSAYDALIENCQRRIHILQATGRIIYCEWFVHFRFPGHEKCSRVHSTLGSIPEGWRCRRVSEFADFNRGFEPGAKAYVKEPGLGLIRFLRVGDLSKRDDDTFVAAELAEGRILENSDIAITLDGSVGVVRVGLSGAYSTGIRKVVVRDESHLGWSFAYQLLCSESIQAVIRAHAKGTTIKHAGTAVAALEFVSPPPALIRLFEEATSPMLKEILNLEQRIENLRRTRDLLLPRLLSGQVNLEKN